MSDTRTERLEILRRDLDRLSEAVEDLSRRAERDQRVAREELVGAEILAGREAVASLSLAWETAEGMAELYRRQTRYLLDDWVTTWSALAAEPSGSPLGAVGNHLERRIAHVVEGVNEGIALASRQSERACEALYRLWSPFTAVVRRDWSRPRRA